MITKVISADEPGALDQVQYVLSAGGIVAFPTDTVYGVGAMVHVPAAIQDLYSIKDRQRSKAIPVLVGLLEEMEQVAVDVPGTARRLAERFWPGPLTIVVPRHPDLPRVLSPFPTIGVRMPDHPIALALLRLSGPLAVTSANLSGEANTCTAADVEAQLGGLIAIILDGGRAPGGEPSTVVDPSGGRLSILRRGPISKNDLLAASID